VDDATADAVPGVLAGEEEAQQLQRGGVASEAQDDADPIAHGGIGGGQQGGAGAHAHGDDRGGRRARGQRGDHGPHVVRAQAPPGEAGNRGHGHLEAGAGQEGSGLAHPRLVLALGRVAVHQHERHATLAPTVDGDALDGQRLPAGWAGQR
jgi:hypothetical protein